MIFCSTTKQTPGPHTTFVKTPLNALCFEKALPVHENLTDDELFLRCSRSLTQNFNKSLHSVIWSRCSKEVYVSKNRVKLTASLTISEYNAGTKRTIIEILRNLGLPNGQNTKSIAEKATEKIKAARRAITLAQMRREEELAEREETLYGVEMF